MCRWRYWPKGWWCPQHPWPSAWARALWPSTSYYSIEPTEELRALEDLKKSLEVELTGITKRIEELKKVIQERKQ
ncbi:MAG: DUF5320 domain-containing protein [Candidatus Bathyarchaeia archaeon]